ncbi:unnamed protein product [Echinostoma caproni]|uniref:SAP domain-containing protein n=1 Tax=Echinostoma caproni TaxID=27848 RepID=A0A183B9B8_9TREM|nr:unnamed protein product [Echinostoma caproni]
MKYSDRLEEQMCDRLVADTNDLTLQRKLLEEKDLTFAEVRKICEQHGDLMKTTSNDAVTLFQWQKTRLRKLLEEKDLTFAEVRKICEQHGDLMKTTSNDAVTLFQWQKTRLN